MAIASETQLSDTEPGPVLGQAADQPLHQEPAAALPPGFDHADSDGGPPPTAGNHRKLLVGFLLLLALGVGAVALVFAMAPSAGAFGGCGGG